MANVLVLPKQPLTTLLVLFNDVSFTPNAISLLCDIQNASVILSLPLCTCSYYSMALTLLSSARCTVFFLHSAARGARATIGRHDRNSAESCAACPGDITVTLVMWC